MSTGKYQIKHILSTTTPKPRKLTIWLEYDGCSLNVSTLAILSLHNQRTVKLVWKVLNITKLTTKPNQEQRELT